MVLINIAEWIVGIAIFLCFSNVMLIILRIVNKDTFELINAIISFVFVCGVLLALVAITGSLV